MTFASKSVSEVLLISWQPGMACFSTSGSLSAFHTASRVAGITSSPLIFMTSPLPIAPASPGFPRRGPELLEGARRNRPPDALHQVLIVGDVRPRDEHHAQELAG